MYIDITDFIVNQKADLGSSYEIAMSFFVLLTISLPFWSIYCFACSMISLIASYAKNKSDYVVKQCTLARNILDGIYNPCALPIYNYFVAKYLSYFDNYFYYNNSLGMRSHHPFIYLVLVAITYQYWIKYTTMILRFLLINVRYELDLQTRSMSPSRIFGACALVIVIFDFNTTIDELLHYNVYFGIILACTGFLYRLFALYNEQNK